MHRRRLTAFAAAAALLVIAAPVAAQDQLRFGQTVRGDLSEDDVRTEDGFRHDAWTFAPRAGQRVELTLRSTEFDALIEVTSPDGAEVLWSDDDSLAQTEDGAGDARVRFTAPGGAVIVRARGYEADALGAYELAVIERPPAPRAPRPSAVRVGQTVTGTLDDRDPEVDDDGGPYDAWRVRLRRGERMLVTLTSDDFDPVLRVGEGDFAELAMNDDDGTSLNSRLVFDAPRDGDFIIRVQSLGGGQGAYALTLAAAPPVPPAYAFSLGLTAEGELTATAALDDQGRPVDRWTFPGTAGQRVRIDMSSEAFDTYLELFDPAGALVAEDDDGLGEGTDSRITRTLLADGTYTIHARAFAPGGTGAYTLSSSEVAPEREAQPLAFGAVIEGEIDETDPTDDEDRGFDAYVFSGVEGQRVQAIMRSGDFDAFLRIGPADGEFEALASDDDGLGQGTDSRLNFTLPSDGDYILRASPLSSGTDGLYSLELTDRGPKPAVGSVLVGARVRGTLSEADDAASDGSWFDAYEIQARADEPLRIVMASNAFDAFVVVGRQKEDGGFEVLGSDDDSLSDTHARLDWEAPSDGTYIIRAGSFGAQEAGAYVLTVEHAPKD
jgi:hypothetical protein